MSEKTEGRREGFVGWMKRSAIHFPGSSATIALSPKGIYEHPVYVQVLDPDGPKPGETWAFNGREVEIVRPSNVERDGSVASWWVRDPKYDDLVWLRTQQLTRAPETRTVTVNVDGCTATVRVSADRSSLDLMAAIRGAVEVETT